LRFPFCRLSCYAAEQPNVIFFIADDVSWNDYGCYGSQTGSHTQTLMHWQHTDVDLTTLT
jgi:arylsulfatase A-like enzyme